MHFYKLMQVEGLNFKISATYVRTYVYNIVIQICLDNI